MDRRSTWANPRSARGAERHSGTVALGRTGAAALFGLALVVAGPATGAGWPTLGEGPKAGPGAGEGDAALLVAIETYATVGAIPGARKNIEDWYLYLTHTRGIAPSRVRILRDQEATVERMRKQAAEAATMVAAGKTLWL